MADDFQPPPNRFNQMMRRTETPQQRLAHDLKQFEAQRVRYVMTRLGLKYYLPAFFRLFEDQAGRAELRFGAFNDYFPTFPFVFACSLLQSMPVPWVGGDGTRTTPLNYRVHRDPNSLEPARFKKFAWVPFVVAYKDFYNTQSAAIAAGRRVALIFPRRGFLHGMVIHDDDTEQFWNHGLCWVYKFPKRDRRLYVQPLSSLVEAIFAHGRGWHPPGESAIGGDDDPAA